MVNLIWLIEFINLLMGYRMKIFAISDLHLSFNCDKPMDIFGGNWENYTDKIRNNWIETVDDEDIVLIAGDISWAMKLDEATSDLEWVDKLPGKKIIIKGNHEYWWKSISAVRSVLPNSISAIQNDCIKVGSYIICGTRGWTVPETNKPLSDEDNKIYKREVERLKLTLASMQSIRDGDDKVIVMIHYPPYTFDKQETEFTKLFKEFNVDKVVFGHLHGRVKCDKFVNLNGIDYYFTSCDHIDMKPVLLYED